jgi:excisionase family DNA binding protein
LRAVAGPPPPAAVFASLSFPKDRTILNVHEVAQCLRVSHQHVVDLIDEGRLEAVNIGSTGVQGRKYYRIPVEAFERYVRANRT